MVYPVSLGSTVVLTACTSNIEPFWPPGVQIGCPPTFPVCCSFVKQQMAPSLAFPPFYWPAHPFIWASAVFHHYAAGILLPGAPTPVGLHSLVCPMVCHADISFSRRQVEHKINLRDYSLVPTFFKARNFMGLPIAEPVALHCFDFSSHFFELQLVWAIFPNFLAPLPVFFP